MPGRKYQATTNSQYRYSINGQEKESDLNENVTTAMYWEYDSRIGRRWNIDPKQKIWESPYTCFSDNPILLVDILGDTTINGQKMEAKDASHASTLGEVVVVAKPKVSGEEKTAIKNSSLPFQNKDERWYGKDIDYSMRNNNVTFWQVYNEFRDGKGPTNSVFGARHPLTTKVKNDVMEVDRLRYLIYNKYGEALKSGDFFTNFRAYNGRFLPWKDNPKSAPQFVGTFSGDVFVSTDGKSLVFVISDSKSVTSLFYRIANDHDRVPIPWNYEPSIFDGCLNCQGNTYQKYTWTEPINYEWFKKQDRDSNGYTKTKYGPEY